MVVSSGCVRSRQDHVFAESYEFEYEYGYCTVATAASSTVLVRYISTVLYSTVGDMTWLVYRQKTVTGYRLPSYCTYSCAHLATTVQYRTVPVQYSTVPYAVDADHVNLTF